MAREDLGSAVEILQRVDLSAFAQLEQFVPQLQSLAAAMAETLERGGRIFLGGCGATGRLSISLETFARSGLLGDGLQDAVLGFMAGGDAALVRSIERFEDYPDYGRRQLRELGFGEGDMLIGITEGGETPFVIGATEEGVALSSVAPYFIYCNPDELLMEVSRSRRVLENEGIRKINLTVGPMALTGSTRMQASTVQMAAVGWALACRREPARIAARLREFRRWLERTDWSSLGRLIERESAAYCAGDSVIYEPGEFGITVLTDTTERSPTFSLVPFENALSSEDEASWCYLHVTAPNAAAAWRSILCRESRTLAWGGMEHLTGEAQLLGFDISDQGEERRAAAAIGPQRRFKIHNHRDHIELALEEVSFSVPAIEQDLFSRHLMLKLLLNAHSTLVMGRQGRFEGNVMTHVNATNNKLIDRAIRYVRLLANSKHGIEVSYEEAARVLFDVKGRLAGAEPIVLRTVDALVAQDRGRVEED